MFIRHFWDPNASKCYVALLSTTFGFRISNPPNATGDRFPEPEEDPELHQLIAEEHQRLGDKVQAASPHRYDGNIDVILIYDVIIRIYNLQMYLDCLIVVNIFYTGHWNMKLQGKMTMVEGWQVL